MPSTLVNMADVSIQVSFFTAASTPNGMPMHNGNEHGCNSQQQGAGQCFHQYFHYIFFGLVRTSQIRHFYSQVDTAADKKPFQLFLLYFILGMNSQWAKHR